MSYVGYLWCRGDVRLSDLVGLDCLLGVWNCAEDVEPKLLGIPSLIPPIPSSNPPPETFLVREGSLRGSGKLDSGPASPYRCSRLFRRLVLFMLLAILGDGGDRDMSELRWGGEGWKNESVGEGGGELIIPGGSGRGPRKTIVSRLWSCAVCCRIECLRFDICCRNATTESNFSVTVNCNFHTARHSHQDRRERQRRTRDLAHVHLTISGTMGGRASVVGKRRS